MLTLTKKIWSKTIEQNKKQSLSIYTGYFLFDKIPVLIIKEKIY